MLNEWIIVGLESGGVTGFAFSTAFWFLGWGIGQIIGLFRKITLSA